MSVLGYFDGKFIDVENDKIIGMEDRGHQFGDGIYEATRFYNGKCFQLKRHLDRCMSSLKKVRMEVPYTAEDLAKLHEELIAKSGFKNGVVYFQFTRGTAPRDHHFPNVKPHLSMSIRSSEVNEQQQAEGVKCFLTEDIRWHHCDIKSLNLLGNVLAKQAADDAGCYEAVLYRPDTKEVTECGSSNFFMIKDGVLWSHPTNNLILKGITLSVLLEDIAPAIGVKVMEKEFTPEFAFTADEAFITSTSLEVTPCIELGGKAVGNGKIGEITLKLQKAYKEAVKKECF